jgi:glyoxalase family protein
METNYPILGLHHVTAIAGDPQANFDFYAKVLGLRLVKKTVNFDDPYTYHLYYGDGVGSPGTILTFFPWANSFPGRRGTGQTTATAFAVPLGSLDFWAQRLRSYDFGSLGPVERLGERYLLLQDPDGMVIELVETGHAEAARIWASGPVPADFAIRGFHNVTLTENSILGTASVLEQKLGFRRIGEAEGRTRFAVDAGAAAQLVDVVADAAAGRAAMGTGTVHHIAFRIGSYSGQSDLRERLADGGMSVSEILDRNYFRSIYFREPGGVLFEVATDAPGFSVDEPAQSLGERLQLPPWLEPRRQEIEGRLPRLETSLS